jgi:NAD(P)-dependent dehydrogenase (short-subunit alcohol dehydrogenase family)
MGINVDGVVYGTIAALPHLQARGGGQIVFTSSPGGLAGWAADPYYSMSKAAVNSWMQAMSALLQAKNIKVNTVDPGAPTDGGMPSVDYREMKLPLQDPNIVGRGIVGVMQGDSNGVAWVQQGEGPMVDQAAARAAAAAGGGGSSGGGGIMTEEARAKLSGRG